MTNNYKLEKMLSKISRDTLHVTFDLIVLTSSTMDNLHINNKCAPNKQIKLTLIPGMGKINLYNHQSKTL